MVTDWKRAKPFNLTDEELIKAVKEQMAEKGYGSEAQKEVLRRYLQAIEHNKKDQATLTLR